jgi:hypothetical protein
MSTAYLTSNQVVNQETLMISTGWKKEYGVYQFNQYSRIPIYTARLTKGNNTAYICQVELDRFEYWTVEGY